MAKWKGNEGERNVGRLFLRRGYLAWRTAQNRQSIRDDESDDVSATMAPEHMRCGEDGAEDQHGEYLDLSYIDKDQYPERGEYVKPISGFEPIENLIIEVKNGYDVKTYNKRFAGWLEKVRRQTPPHKTWALFYRRNYSSPFEYRVCYEKDGVTVITIDKEETMKAIDEIAGIANAKNKTAA
jgi:hypothetical protein